MILVTGATGNFGSKVVEHLIKKGVNPSEISVLVRNSDKAVALKEKGVQIKVGDYMDSVAMEKAFLGVDKLLLVSSNSRQSFSNRSLHHKNAIKAAKKSNVKHIIYTSFVRKAGYQESSIADFQESHIESENYLKESGIDYTILQNGIYAEMILAFVGSDVVENGTINFPAEDGKASWVLREELAEAAALVLITSDHENKTYTLTNVESIGFKKIATMLSEVLGKNIEYLTPHIYDYKAIMENANVPNAYIDMFIMWSTALVQKTMDLEDKTLSTFLNREPTSVREFIKSIYA